jgi:hypothetical protein
MPTAVFPIVLDAVELVDGATWSGTPGDDGTGAATFVGNLPDRTTGIFLLVHFDLPPDTVRTGATIAYTKTSTKDGGQFVFEGYVDPPDGVVVNATPNFSSPNTFWIQLAFGGLVGTTGTLTIASAVMTVTYEVVEASAPGLALTPARYGIARSGATRSNLFFVGIMEVVQVEFVEHFESSIDLELAVQLRVEMTGSIQTTIPRVHQ